jgi:hypothetical protein
MRVLMNKNLIKDAFDDLKNKRFIEAYATLFIVVIFIGISIFRKEMTDIYMSKVILATLSMLLFINILERRETRELASKNDVTVLTNQLEKIMDVEGISCFHISRKGIIPLEVSINKTEKEIIFYSVQHNYIVNNCLDYLEEMANKGKKIKILIMADKQKNGKRNPNVEQSELHRDYFRLRNEIEDNTLRLVKWWNDLNPYAQENVEIKSYVEFPVATYTIIDRESSFGYIVVELLFFSFGKHEQPHFIVEKQKCEDLFNKLSNSFDKLWGNAQWLSRNKS